MDYKSIEEDIQRVLLSPEEITALCRRLGKEVCRDYAGKNLVAVVILKGSMVFSSEMMKYIDLPLEVEFMKVSSYGGGTHTSGIINVKYDLQRNDLSDLDLLLVEDIVDTGRTLSRLVELLRGRGARSVRTMTLLNKPSRREVEFTPDYIGTDVPDEFVVGFGLDYNEKYRNLPYVGVLKHDVYEQ